MTYLYKTVCCVESVENIPPFLGVSCQIPKIVPRARYFGILPFHAAQNCNIERGREEETASLPHASP